MNYASGLNSLQRYAEAKTLLCKTIPVARRVLGENNELTLKMRRNYARALYKDADATLDDLREAVTTLEETERVARRVLGGAHPTTARMEEALRASRTKLRAHEFWWPFMLPYLLLPWCRLLPGFVGRAPAKEPCFLP